MVSSRKNLLDILVQKESIKKQTNKQTSKQNWKSGMLAPSLKNFTS